MSANGKRSRPPVTWLDALPERIDGLVLANEVLDAVPCEVVRFADDHYQQARVTMIDDHFEWRWQPLLDGRYWRRPSIGCRRSMAIRAKSIPKQKPWSLTLASQLGDGALCFIDYGFPRREYYLAERRSGTLACHYQQRVHFDPLILAGLQDVTAHVISPRWQKRRWTPAPA